MNPISKLCSTIAAPIAMGYYTLASQYSDIRNIGGIFESVPVTETASRLLLSDKTYASRYGKGLAGLFTVYC